MVWLAVRGYRVVGFGAQPDRRAGIFRRAARTAAASSRTGPFKQARRRARSKSGRRRAAAHARAAGPGACGLRPRGAGGVAAVDARGLRASFAALMPARQPHAAGGVRIRAAAEATGRPSRWSRTRSSACTATFRIRELERIDIIAESPKFAEAGLECAVRSGVCLTRASQPSFDALRGRVPVWRATSAQRKVTGAEVSACCIPARAQRSARPPRGCRARAGLRRLDPLETPASVETARLVPDQSLARPTRRARSCAPG